MTIGRKHNDTRNGEKTWAYMLEKTLQNFIVKVLLSQKVLNFIIEKLNLPCLTYFLAISRLIIEKTMQKTRQNRTFLQPPQYSTTSCLLGKLYTVRKL